MFDLTSSKLLLLGIIALLVVGPKDLPALLRTVGRYVGMIRRQAADFRAQFDEAMRDGELAELRKEMENFGQEAESAVRQAETQLHNEMSAIETETRAAMEAAEPQPSTTPEGTAAGTSEPDAAAVPAIDVPSEITDGMAAPTTTEASPPAEQPNTTKNTTTERAGA